MSYSWPDQFEKEELMYFQVEGTETYKLYGSGTAYTKAQIYASVDETENDINFYTAGLLDYDNAGAL